MAKITLSKTTKGWQAVFIGSTEMPNGVAIPLPFSAAASGVDVALDMDKRFPGYRVSVPR